ncbi:MAG TPA: hypothetical protein VM260_15260 [Pirellula sp.]|nr:hypothetical protein [Pirellula sp.]
MNFIITPTASTLTPNYVLLNGRIRLAPIVLPLQSGRICTSLYGFSDKIPYDSFRANSKLALTPFPLVKVYLRTLLETGSENLHLVIVDATGPHDPSIRAATMEAVLEAQMAHSSSVLAEYSLTFDASTNAYRVNEA